MTYRFRVIPELLDQIETLLPPERGEDGTPSAHDFIAHDLFAIGDHVIEHWEDMPRLFAGRDDYARHVEAGNTVAVISLVVQRIGDEIIGVDIDIDRRGLPSPNEDEDQDPF